MSNEKGPLSWIKALLTKQPGNNKKNGKYPYLLVAVVLGAAVMLMGNLFGQGSGPQQEQQTAGETAAQEDVAAFGQKKTEETGMIKEYEKEYESQLKDALEGIVGVEDVTVVVNVDATEKRILEKNTVTQSQSTDEIDREGGKRGVEDLSKDEQLVIIKKGENEAPIVLETKKPAIRGVLVVAKGADNIQVKKWIIEAVTRVLDVPSHQVAVMPKKTKGE